MKNEQELITKTRIHLGKWERIKILFGAVLQVEVKLTIILPDGKSIERYNGVAKISFISANKYVFEQDKPEYGYTNGPFLH